MNDFLYTYDGRALFTYRHLSATNARLKTCNRKQEYCELDINSIGGDAICASIDNGTSYTCINETMYKKIYDDGRPIKVDFSATNALADTDIITHAQRAHASKRAS